MTEEVRTTSSTGGEKGVKPQRHSLLPKHGLDVIAEVFGFGAAKYADHNWRRKYEWSKSYDALQRHLTAWWDGEDIDPESGLSHLGHAGFHILVLATWERLDGQGSEFDDRHTFNRPQESAAEEEARLLEFEAALDEVEWRDPVPRSLKVMQDAINQTVGFALDAVHPATFRLLIGLPRFSVNGAGEISDADHPVAAVEPVSYANRWVREYDLEHVGPDLLPKRRPVDEFTLGDDTHEVQTVEIRITNGPEERDFEWPVSMRTHLQRALDRRP